MLDLKGSSRNASKAQSPSEDLDGASKSSNDAREGRSEMVIVIGVVALISMIFGFALGLLF